MDISGISGAAAAVSLQYAMSAKIMKQSMDFVEEAMGTLMEGLEAAITGIGGNIDIMV